MDVNSLPKTVTRQHRRCDLNIGPSVPESSTLTTRLPSHPLQKRQMDNIILSTCYLYCIYRASCLLVYQENVPKQGGGKQSYTTNNSNQLNNIAMMTDTHTHADKPSTHSVINKYPVYYLPANFNDEMSVYFTAVCLRKWLNIWVI